MCNLKKIIIDKKFTGKGLGTKTLKLAINNFLKIKPNTPIISNISSANKASVNIHLKLGFKKATKQQKIGNKMLDIYIFKN